MNNGAIREQVLKDNRVNTINTLIMTLQTKLQNQGYTPEYIEDYGKQMRLQLELNLLARISMEKLKDDFNTGDKRLDASAVLEVLTEYEAKANMLKQIYGKSNKK